MQTPAAVAHIAAGNPAVSCPVCGSVPLDRSGTCPSGYCRLHGLVITSSEAQKLAAEWLAGRRPWRESP